MVTQEEQALRHQRELISHLKDIYALVNVSRLAITRLGQEETDDTCYVLAIVVSRLFDLIEVQQQVETRLDQEAFPHYYQHRMGGVV